MAKANPLAAFPTLAEGLDSVEEELRASVITNDTFLTEVASHLIVAGGKRVRPGFTLAASVAAGTTDAPVTPEAVMGGVACELVHIGSLYHDDVMDEAETRRAAESVNHRWGNLRAILAGDFLLARASEIAASLGTEVAGLLANTIARLCEGQVRELQDAFNVKRTEADYLLSIEGKTASLLATSCRVGAIVADLPRTLVDTLTRFGHSYGMAFQVVDDILDVTATDVELGKPAGNDLLEGIYTLPVLRTLQGEFGADLEPLLGQELDDHQRDQARDIVRSSAGPAQALTVAERYTDEAMRSLEPLRDTPAHIALTAAGEHLMERVGAVSS